MVKTDECCFIKLPQIIDARGNLTVVEELNHIPFEIARVSWIYDVPMAESIEGNAFKDHYDVIIALSGSFDVITNDRKSKNRTSVNSHYSGLLIPPMTWHCLENFSTNAVCLVLSSKEFNENDYIKNSEKFLNFKKPLNTAPSRSIDVINNEFKPVEKISVSEARLIKLPSVRSQKACMSIVVGKKNLFETKRIFALFDITDGQSRGSHSHYECDQFLVAVSGSFEVLLDDGINKKKIKLCDPSYGLYIPAGIWASEESFSLGAVCLVLASHLYDESDYIREYDIFLRFKENAT